MASLAAQTFQMLLPGQEHDYNNFYPDPESPSILPQSFPFSNGRDVNMDNAFGFEQAHEGMPVLTGYNTMYGEPQYPHGSPQVGPSNYSTASGASAQSSAMNSPHSIQGHTFPQSELGQLALNPSIVGYDSYTPGGDFAFHSGMDDFPLFQPQAKPNGFVDPSTLHPLGNTPSATQSAESNFYPPLQAPFGSPSLSQAGRSPRPFKYGSQSPHMNGYHPYYRRPSIQSNQSFGSQDGNFSSEGSKEKNRCPLPDCGKIFKDLKAHMLTHQNERPEKCPIQTCEFHIRGFARKYDKNRHTLTHYKGNMVCGFCPGSGTQAEKSFNRADVFKRHLTSVHGVEQSPPNSRKKLPGSATGSKKNLTGYAPDATGKCSTCSRVFSNAQEFYEHLDDCVLRIVQQEEPSEAINAARLAEVEDDRNVHETLRNNALPITTTNFSADEEDEDDDVDDDNDGDYTVRSGSSRAGRSSRNPPNGVQKSRGLTHSKGGVKLNTKGRKKRKDYPSSWGCPNEQMKLKKRVLCVFDGPRRLWKDDMMLDQTYEVRLQLKEEDKFVTDLDVQTMRRAEAFHSADESEKGPWIADDLTGLDLEKLLEVKRDDVTSDDTSANTV